MIIVFLIMFALLFVLCVFNISSINSACNDAKFNRAQINRLRERVNGMVSKFKHVEKVAYNWIPHLTQFEESSVSFVENMKRRLKHLEKKEDIESAKNLQKWFKWESYKVEAKKDKK